MRPNLALERRNSWLVFGCLALVCVIVLAVLFDWGAAGETLGQEARSYGKRIGPMPLADQVDQQKEANDRLRGRLGELKKQVGISEVPPFLMPDEKNKEPPGEYFLVAYNQIWTLLQKMASERQLKEENYDHLIGFKGLRGIPPSASDTRYYLTMLQLVTKAVYLALQAEGNSIRYLRIAEVDPRNIVPTGPAGRPPLLREYPFQMEVHGSLRDILWLLHVLSDDQRDGERERSRDGERERSFPDAHRRFSAWLKGVATGMQETGKLNVKSDISGKGNDVCPLILRGLTIGGPNDDPDVKVYDGLAQLSATFSLAGMEFLPDEERGEAPAQEQPGAPVPRSGTRRGPSGTRSRPVAVP